MSIKKALVIGGSNGIGLALSRVLSDTGADVHILDIAEPDRNIIAENECVYSRFDMRFPNMDMIARFAEDRRTNALIITAGIGRVSEFQNFSMAEIEKTITINMLSSVKIVRAFYDKLLTGGGGKERIFTAV